MNNPLTQQPVTDDQLKSIVDLALRQQDLEAQRKNLEERLDKISTQIRQVQEGLLPEAMLAIGMESFVMSDGTSIDINKFYAAKIPEDKASEAFAWLRKNGHEAIIKREIKCQFGKGEDEKANAIKVMLMGAGVVPSDKAGVHPQTLKAFVKERIEGGQELPTDVFGVFVGNRAKLTPAKPTT